MGHGYLLVSFVFILFYFFFIFLLQTFLYEFFLLDASHLEVIAVWVISFSFECCLSQTSEGQLQKNRKSNRLVVRVCVGSYSSNNSVKDCICWLGENNVKTPVFCHVCLTTVHSRQTYFFHSYRFTLIILKLISAY